MIPLLRPLPLLIKEKVEFYYYRQKWLEKIKIMHQQYRKHVEIREFDKYEYIYFVTWTSSDKISICIVDGTYAYWKCDITNFTRAPYRWGLLELPRKYQYSSGLNNPSGYK
jgi:hypothetical protein